MAEYFLILHFLFILYMIVGFVVGLAINHRGFRFVHAGLLAFVSTLMILGIPCPLTILEEHFSSADYEGSFLAVWLNRIIYLEWFDPGVVFVGDMTFAMLVFSSFFWRPLPPRQ
ncbi:DUF2784 family protein [Nitrospina watsonii]|uniref:DUF2784 domain-containing protein n=1 Tax=Nitrospina watsonii TaxID=1323948 RepID=A0ABM9HD65_9BACT|nr:DUF2784 family protein [Nitrospina watsonii]CAI2718159.1 conserved membrane protein of unknown function [Nitrospina watsonii]